MEVGRRRRRIGVGGRSQKAAAAAGEIDVGIPSEIGWDQTDWAVRSFVVATCPGPARPGPAHEDTTTWQETHGWAGYPLALACHCAPSRLSPPVLCVVVGAGDAPPSTACRRRRQATTLLLRASASWGCPNKQQTTHHGHALLLFLFPKALLRHRPIPLRLRPMEPTHC